MPTMPPTFRPRHAPSRADHQRAHDRQRGSAAKRGYGRAWQKASKAYLAAHPCCRACEQRGHVTAASEVDHVIPHRGDMALFWDSANWQPLCHSCHSSKTAREDRAGGAGGGAQGVGVGQKSTDRPA